MSTNSTSQEKGRKLYIGGLMEDIHKDDLIRELNKHGEVVDVWIARNPPGFAFVEYVKAADAEKAVRALDGVTICGSRVRVEFAHGGRSKNAPGMGFRGSRSGGRGSRRYDSPPRRGRMSPPMQFDSGRYSYDQLAPFYHPEVANAAAAAAGFPYGVPGYPSMLPFLPPEDFIRSLQQQTRRRTPPGRIPPLMFSQRGRSPGARRRSRSPMTGGGRMRGRSPSPYDNRGPGRRGPAGYGDYPRGRMPRPPRSFSPGPDINGRREDSRTRRRR